MAQFRKSLARNSKTASAVGANESAHRGVGRTTMRRTPAVGLEGSLKCQPQGRRLQSCTRNRSSPGQRRGAPLTLGNDTNPERGSEADNAQQLLVLAYMRLCVLPKRSDGSKLTTLATFGAYRVRLVELTSRSEMLHPLWIELFDGRAGRVIDSVGFPDFRSAGQIVEVFMAEAVRLSGIALPSTNSQ